MIRFAALGVALLLPVAAFADPAAGDACAKSLNRDSRAIYDRIGADLKPGDDVRAALKAKVPEMVKAGEIARASARGNAQAAGRRLAKR